MRIGIDGRFIQDHYPGIGRYTYQLALTAALLNPQDEFVILTSATAPNSRYALGNLAGLSNVRLVPFFRQPASAANLFGMRSPIDRLHLDVVHFPHFQMPLVLHSPVVATLHDLTPRLVPRAMPNRAARFAFMAWIRAAAHKANQVITGSQCAARDMQHYLGIPSSRLTVIPHGVENAFQPLETAKISQVLATLGLTRPYLLYCGSNKPHKNIGRLIEGWAILPETLRTTCSLVFAGAQDARFPTSQDFAERYEVVSSVISLGECQSANLPAIYNGARGFIFPSLYEGFGLPLLEAMACGTPTACANHPALLEVAGSATLTFEACETRQIALVMERLLTDAALRAQLASSGIERARDFTWEKSAARTMMVYRKALERPGSK